MAWLVGESPRNVQKTVPDITQKEECTVSCCVRKGDASVHARLVSDAWSCRIRHECTHCVQFKL